MKTHHLLYSLLLIGGVWASLKAQGNAEIYALSMTTIDGETSFGEPQNLSNNPGYDSQPSFFDSTTLLFSSTRNGQTDIAQYLFLDKTKIWLSSTRQGSEYSPLLIPNDRAVSAIRLDTTGLQRLYRYPLSGEASQLLFQKAKIGYHVWVDANQLVATVLVENRMDLVLAQTNPEEIQTVFDNVGRSLHRIPSSNKVSFVQTNQGKSTVYALDPSNGTIETLAALNFSITDMYWFSNTSFLYSVGEVIMEFDLTIADHKVFYQNKATAVTTITRILVSPDKTKLIFVGE